MGHVYKSTESASVNSATPNYLTVSSIIQGRAIVTLVRLGRNCRNSLRSAYVTSRSPFKTADRAYGK